MATVLYISYDGLLEPLGQSQVWQYLRRLAHEHRIFLITFEKPEDLADRERMDQVRRECERSGVHWKPLRYHKKPTAPATAFDILAGIGVGLGVVLRHRIQIVHARSYVPSLMALVLKRLTGVRFIFDMRGFWADERVDGGLWPAGGSLYRATKAMEQRLLLGADAVVSLTHAAVNVMRKFDYLKGRPIRFEVIPTCANLSLFSPKRPTIEDQPFTLGYVGSVGVWYLFDDVVMAFKELRKFQPDARFLVVNRGGHAQICETVLRLGVPLDAVEVVAAEHIEVPNLIRRMDAAVFFIKPMFSKTASAPTRLAELLGMEVPVLANAGIGDMAQIVLNGGEPVGVVIEEFSVNTLFKAVGDLLDLSKDEMVRHRCRVVAERHFSVEWGSERYSALYQELTPRGNR